MFKTIKAAAAIILASGLLAGAAHATTINGAVTVSDGLQGAGFLPCSTSSIVGDCTQIKPSGPGNTSGGSGDFSGENGLANAIVQAWVFATPGAVNNEICTPNFCFDITFATAPVKGTPLCSGGSCSDTETITISGVVTGAGFDATLFTGSLGLTGSCPGPGNGVLCSGAASGGYTYSLSATGQPLQTPEPGTLALLGLAFLGAGAARRRMK
jgi:hypothetical protein